MSNPFGQMLKLWRQRLGLSQLDLSLKSDMSAKHISFLETGRSTPSKDAVIKLANALSLSATDTQLLMKQAGFHIEQDSFSSSSDVELALKMILDKHEPYPGVISDYCLEPQYLNNAAIKLLEWIEVDLTHFSSIVDVIFSEQGFRSYITNWDEMATVTIRLTKMKSMAMQDDERFQEKLSTVLRNPEFHKIWKREEQYIGNTDPIVPINIEAKGETLSWKVILSTFGTPRNVSLDEYQMEFFYPADQHTSEFAHRFFLDS